MARIGVIGCGYVGLSTAVLFANLGNQVVGVDIDEAKVAQMQGGLCPVFEPGLGELLERNVNAKRLQFTTDYTRRYPMPISSSSVSIRRWGRMAARICATSGRRRAVSVARSRPVA